MTKNLFINKKLLFFVIFILFLAGVVLYGYQKATPEAKDNQNLPKIEISPKSYDFGEIEFGKIVNYTFKIRNTGKEILEIKRVATSCGCTTAKTGKTQLSAGEETDLLVTYDTAAMGSGPHGTGNQERIIYVKSNDPINPQTEVIITAYVK